MFKDIRTKISLFILKRKASKIEREKEFNNFETAKTIGVLFNATDEKEYIESKSFIKNLEKSNANISALGFVETPDEITHLPYEKNINYFALNNVNWLYIAKDQSVLDFEEQHFDLFFNLSGLNNIELLQISLLSKAKMKIGRSGKNQKFFDFIIEIPENESLKVFIQQIKHYLSLIRKA